MARSVKTVSIPTERWRRILVFVFIYGFSSLGFRTLPIAVDTVQRMQVNVWRRETWQWRRGTRADPTRLISVGCKEVASVDGDLLRV